MKNKTSIKLMAATVLASTLLLGACGNKKENTSSDKSSTTTQTTSSSKASSSAKESKPKTTTTTSTTEQNTSASVQSSNSGTQGQETKKTDNSKQSQDKQPTQGNNSQATSNQQAQASQSSQTAQSSYDPTTDRKLHDKQAEHNKRYKGVLTMVDGDFSAAAGNWKGGNGETITVSSGGQFTVETADGKKESYSVQGYSYTLDDGKYNAKVGGGKVIQITTGADGTVSNVALVQP